MPLADDWSYQLGLAFLTAAKACGFTCDRSYVADGGNPEPPAPGCRCQLIAVVTEGWEALPECGARRTAEVRLVLDLCLVVPGQDEVPDPAKVNAQAQLNATARWQIMRGLRRAWQLGELAAVGVGEDLGPMAATLCRTITPGPWRNTRSTGGWARWEATWRFTDNV